MGYRKLIYVFSGLVFAPAMLMLMAGTIFLPTILFLDIGKGRWESLVFFLTVVGGGLGLYSALMVTCDVAGNPISYLHANFKRLALVIGIVTELSVMAFLTPNRQPFMYYWLPPLFGGLVLLGLSCKYSGKSFKQAAQNPVI